mmetsp:Transcript_28633/g.59647  ORF Transcript_28633/g.59647 Transcript_28633/m.59647 type:complete len:219 (+) Transcript_28633:373-1029(+)
MQQSINHDPGTRSLRKATTIPTPRLFLQKVNTLIISTIPPTIIPNQHPSPYRQHQGQPQSQNGRDGIVPSRRPVRPNVPQEVIRAESIHHVRLARPTIPVYVEVGPIVLARGSGGVVGSVVEVGVEEVEAVVVAPDVVPVGFFGPIVVANRFFVVYLFYFFFFVLELFLELLVFLLELFVLLFELLIFLLQFVFIFHPSPSNRAEISSSPQISIAVLL